MAKKPFRGAVGPGELVIDESTPKDDLFRPVVDGQKKKRGYDPSQVVPQMFDPPRDLPLIPRSEWSERIKEMEATKSRISDMLLAADIPSTDQDGHGYCWAYSTGGCVIALRAINNQPYVRINPHSVAAIIKGGRDEGGWCGLSAKFLREHGIATEDVWPKHSRSLSNDNDRTRANMALHKVTEEWTDLARDVYDQNLTFDQLATCLLSRIPCAVDYNWWGHSVLACDVVEPERGSFCVRIRNSWTDGWGERGFSVLSGSRSVPDGALAIRVTGASPV